MHEEYLDWPQSKISISCYHLCMQRRARVQSRWTAAKSSSLLRQTKATGGRGCDVASTPRRVLYRRRTSDVVLTRPSSPLPYLCAAIALGGSTLCLSSAASGEISHTVPLNAQASSTAREVRTSSTPCLGPLSEHVDWTLMVGQTCKMYSVFRSSIECLAASFVRAWYWVLSATFCRDVDQSLQWYPVTRGHILET